jgi:pentapeptide MXKDX repeat protein
VVVFFAASSRQPREGGKMKKLITAIIAACFSMAVGGSYAADDMKKDAMKKDSMSKGDAKKGEAMTKDDDKKKSKKDEMKK